MLIHVIDDLPPEACAMVQALYSRSPKSVTEHLKRITVEGVNKFMSLFYVGYGHKSIGDCGSTSIFIEGVSMLAAKAIQDWPLYSGQEASTRYLDMAKAGYIGDAEINERWLQMYRRVLATMIDTYERANPLQNGQEIGVWNKAIRARAFDVARGFLPAGCLTYVSWHSNLRQISDHLKEMAFHPLPEVRNIAIAIEKELVVKYPSSFNGKRYQKDQEAYIEQSMLEFAYIDKVPGKFTYKNNLNIEGLLTHGSLLSERPARCELHQRLRKYGTIDFSFPLDFGSYRDLQRQRSCVQDMPLLCTDYGFSPWYLEQLPDWLRSEAESFLLEQETRINSLGLDYFETQYLVALGYTVCVEISCSLPSAVYIAGLRSGDTVHPTLRINAQCMGDAIRACVPGIALHCDMSPGIWNIRRGLQDIVEIK